MIPLFIFWLIKRYREKNKRRLTQVVLKESKNYLPSPSAVPLLIFLILATKTYSQNKTHLYQIMRNGNQVGTIRFTETSTGDIDHLKMESDVKTRFIFSFIAHVSEEAVYRRGVMFHSSIYRRLNGSEKVNKQHQENNGQYIIHAGQRSDVTKTYPITYNMLSLYSKEPVDINKVYSDNFESFVTIQKTGTNTYTVALPDGNYNTYHYKNGVLVLVEVHQTFYSANIVLMN